MGPKYPQKTGDAVKIFGTLLIIKMNLRTVISRTCPDWSIYHRSWYKMPHNSLLSTSCTLLPDLGFYCSHKYSTDTTFWFLICITSSKFRLGHWHPLNLWFIFSNKVSRLSWLTLSFMFFLSLSTLPLTVSAIIAPGLCAFLSPLFPLMHNLMFSYLSVFAVSVHILCFSWVLVCWSCCHGSILCSLW